MEDKKISFGFSKLVKKPNLLKKDGEKPKVDLIDCIVGSSIKIKGEVKVKKAQLVIPMKNSGKSIVQERLESQKNAKNVENSSNGEIKLSLDELARQELINDSTKVLSAGDQKKVHSLPLPSEPTVEGEKESTLEDYENVPINEFGMAMLRGMGWKEGSGIGKSGKISQASMPTLRPKGLGLGADKLAKQDSEGASTACDKDGKELKLVKGAFVYVFAGHQKGKYGKILNMDDEGRFIILLALTSSNVSVNEALVRAVTKEEYDKKSKVVNIAKYEEYSDKKPAESSTRKPAEDSRRREDASRSRRRSPSPEKMYDRHRRESRRNSSSSSNGSSHRRDRKKSKKSKKKHSRRSRS